MDVENKLSCSAPRDRPRQHHCAGFTLIEMMVVIFIIGIVASFATLTVGQSQTRILQDEMKRLQSLLTLGSDEAVLQTEEFALEVYRNGYRFMHLEQAQQEWEWQPVQGNAIFRARCFPEGVELAAEIEGTPTLMERLDCSAEAAELDAEKIKEEESVSSKFSKAEDEPPRIFLLSSGEMTPFELTLSLPDKKSSSRLVGELTGKLTLPAPDDDKKPS